MTRLLLRLLVIACVVVVALFLADQPGQVSLHWNGWRIETSAAVLLVAVLVVIGAGWAILAALSALFGSPRRLARRRREARRLQGYRAMTDGLVAIAAGDADAAERLSRRAESLFKISRHPAPPLTRLITAQSALLRQDHAGARTAFAALAGDGETEFLGLRGLIVQALKSGDEAGALKLVERADRLRPGTAWLLQSRVALEARCGEWRRLQETIDRAAKHRVLTPDRAAHHRMVVRFTRSCDAVKDGRQRDALTYAAQAYALDPGFPPLLLHYTGLLADQGERRKALRILQDGWVRTGNSVLLGEYDRLWAAETPAQRVLRMEKLIARRAHDPAGHLAVAAIALSGRIWGEARRHLNAAGANGPGPFPAPLCRLSIELAQLDGQDEDAVRLWRDRLAQAPAENTWVCSECGGETTDWDALCPHCSAFDSLTWRVPGPGPKSAETGAPKDEFPRLDLAAVGPGRPNDADHAAGAIDIEAAARNQGS